MKEVVFLPIVVLTALYFYIWVVGQFEIAFGNFPAQIFIILSCLLGLGGYIEYCQRDK